MVGKLDIGRGDDGGFFPRLAKAKAEGANVEPLEPEPVEPDPVVEPEPVELAPEPAPKRRKVKKDG